jgi:hypothetical protein
MTYPFPPNYVFNLVDSNAKLSQPIKILDYSPIYFRHKSTEKMQKEKEKMNDFCADLNDLAFEIYRKKYARELEVKVIKNRSPEQKQQFRLAPEMQNPCQEIELSPPTRSPFSIMTTIEHETVVRKLEEINFWIQKLLNYINPHINKSAHFANDFDAQTKFVQVFLEWREFNHQNQKFLILWKDKAHEKLIKIAKNLELD